MSIHVLHKNTLKAGYLPQPEDLATGQLGLQVHSGEVALYTKDSDGNIVRLAPSSGGGGGGGLDPIDLIPYELKKDSEARDEDLQDQIDKLPPPQDLSLYETKADSEAGDQALQDQINGIPAPPNLAPYELKKASEDRDTALQKEVDDLKKKPPTMPEPPNDGEVYGRKQEAGKTSWELIVAGPVDANKTWLANHGEASPGLAEGVMLNDLLYRTKEDQLFIWREFELTGQESWVQILANPGGGNSGGGSPGIGGAIQSISVLAPLTLSGPATDPVIGIDQTALEDRVQDLEKELADLKAQMALILKPGNKILGAMSTPDSTAEDASITANVEIQL